MGAPIDAGDDRVSASLQLVVEATFHQPAKHRIGRLLSMQSEGADIRFAPGTAHGLVHGLDDVASDAELAEGLFEPRLQRPAGGSDGVSQTEAFELGSPSQQQVSQFRVFGIGTGSQIGDAAAFVGDVAQGAIEAGPAFGLDLLLQRSAYLLLAARTKLDGDALGGAISKSPADVFAADDQVLTIVGAAANEDMDMGVIGVPVVDRYPVELRAEIFLDVSHQLASKGLEVPELGRVFRRDDEAEMMAVILAALGEGAFIRRIGGRVEHARVLSVARHAVALQVRDMFWERRGAESCALMADDARLHHHAPRVRAQADR